MVFLHYKIKYMLAIVLLLFFLTGGVYAVDIMPLSQVRPGMEGMGKTVFRGYEVEDFPVQIIDVLEGQGLDDDLILIRAGGEEIERIGGIAAGMSGSPVYVEGKLIGAVSYGWAFSDQHYALLTPIERMLELLDGSDRGTAPLKEDEIKEGRLPGSLRGMGKRAALQTPLYVSGLKGRALKRLEKDLAGYSLKILPETAPLEKQGGEEEIKPGSAVAVQLVRGDINIASIGTVTYREGNDLLAFGHPFLNRGEVDYLLSGAYISSVIPSIEQPFKLGAPTDKLLGSVRADRGAGIAGRLNLFPRIIPLRISITDLDLKREEEVAVQLVRDESILTPLAINVALQSLDSTLDRIGRGTARVFYKLTGNGLPDLGIERNDIYYSQSDIAAMALGDFYQLLNMVVTNPFKKVNLIDIKLEIEVERKDQVALVQEARVLNEKILPGDDLRIEVTIHPYRQESYQEEITVELPEDIQPGMSTVIIDGGYTGQSYQLPTGEELDTAPETNQAIIEGYKSFQEILDDYLKQPRNNELIIQVLPAYPVAVREPPGEDSQGEGADADNHTADNDDEGKDIDDGDKDDNDEGKDIDDGDKNTDKEKDDAAAEDKEKLKMEIGDAEAEVDTGEKEEKPEIKKTVETDYVLEGSLTLDIKIENPGKPDDNAEEDPGAVEDSGEGEAGKVDAGQKI